MNIYFFLSIFLVQINLKHTINKKKTNKQIKIKRRVKRKEDTMKYQIFIFLVIGFLCIFFFFRDAMLEYYKKLLNFIGMNHKKFLKSRRFLIKVIKILNIFHHPIFL